MPDTAAKMQPETPPKPRDMSPWVTIAITIVVGIVTVTASFSTTKVVSDANTREIEEEKQRITELDKGTVKTREMDRVYDALKEINAKLDKLNDRRR